MYTQQQYYQQQPSTSSTTTTAGMVWNGNSWVSSNNNEKNLVQQYTLYYNGWEQQRQQLELQLRSVSHNLVDERKVLENKIQWAQHHSNESSRAAHHYYSNPNGPPPPFPLPPAPPGHNSNSNAGGNITTSHSTQQGNHHQQHDNNISNVPSSSSGGGGQSTQGTLTRYVKRCLDQCSTPEEKKAVQSGIEQVIAKAIQDGNLQSTDWDVVPLVPVPGRRLPVVAPAKAAPGPGHLATTGPSSSYYGQSYGQGQELGHSYLSAPSTTGSYYGPGEQHQQQQQQQDQQYSSVNSSPYGPQPTHQIQGRRKRWGQVSSDTGTSTKTAGEASYYGPSSSISTTNSLSPSNSTSQNYYSNKRGVQVDDEDYVTLPHVSGKGNKYKKPKHNIYSLVNSNSNKGMDSSNDALAKRASRFGGVGQENAHSIHHGSGGQYDRFMGKSVIGGTHKVLDENDYELMTVKGTCRVLEKDYLRLTSPPRAELVRPLPILEQHVKNLNDEYNGSDKEKKHDYLWFCSQFKAVRQDCTVQRILGKFAIEVYESHARIALREGDLNEYNQCQTQLKELYKQLGNDRENSNKKNPSNDQQPAEQQEYLFEYQPHEEEFIAYRLLYYVYLSTNEKFSGGSGDLLHILLSLIQSQRANPAISHALKVREAVAVGDYLAFFRLHNETPNLGTFLTNLLVPTMRLRALRRMAKAYRPSLELRVCLEHLGFISNYTATDIEDEDGPTIDALKTGHEWLVSCGCVINGQEFMTKDSVIHEPAATTKNSLI
jgi:SAC3 family protein LENG8/THP3